MSGKKHFSLHSKGAKKKNPKKLHPRLLDRKKEDILSACFGSGEWFCCLKTSNVAWGKLFSLLNGRFDALFNPFSLDTHADTQKSYFPDVR